MRERETQSLQSDEKKKKKKKKLFFIESRVCLDAVGEEEEERLENGFREKRLISLLQILEKVVPRDEMGGLGTCYQWSASASRPV